MWRNVWTLFVVVFAVAGVACGGDDPDDTVDAAVDYHNEYIYTMCECFDEEVAEQECRDDYGIDSDERSETVECVQDAMADVEAERTESVDEYWSCNTDAYDSGVSCIDDIDNTCNEQAWGALEACDSEVYDQINQCIDDVEGDEAAEAWAMEFYGEIEARGCDLSFF